ncbi:MAG TPA: SpoIIE family protein phosphatase [Thermoanaerobaculia bacterium]|nr:SpoIIE family protein phosphatase [Thermoanaerobaculia bacterium]
MIRLRVLPPEGAPWEHRPEGEALVVGRSLGCDLVLADAFLSRQHARLWRDGDGWWIEDLGSRNGARVNGEAVAAPRRLAPGDRVEMSASALEVLGEAGARASGVSVLPGAAPGDEVDLGDATYFRSAAELLAAERSAAPAPADAARTAERLRLVNEVHRDLGRSLGLDELLERLLDRLFDHLRPEGGAIYLRQPDGGFRAAARRTTAGRPAEAPISRSLVREVAEKGLAALVLDARTDARFAEAHSMLDLGVRSLVAAPLLDGEGDGGAGGGGSLGMIVLDSRLGVRQFTEDDLELLVSLASAAALRIRNVALAEEAAERRRMASELALARRIQVALLPAELPALPGWTLHAGNVPSRFVSGDFYQVVPRAEGREVVLVVADVSGKGMAASLLTASLEALLAAPLEEGLPPEELAARVSRLLHRRTPPEKYATAFLGALDVETGALSYVSAGHNPALVVRAADGTVERLTVGGPPLGLLAEGRYTAGRIGLAAGDTLLVYTDGIVEAADSDDEEYGLERLEALAADRRNEPPAAIAETIEEDVQAFARGVPVADDRTVVIVRRE